MQNFDQYIGFGEKRQFFRRILSKRFIPSGGRQEIANPVYFFAETFDNSVHDFLADKKWQSAESTFWGCHEEKFVLFPIKDLSHFFQRIRLGPI
jgi:hypothetical protein